jgi:alanyl-tRNA synthetase
VNGEELGRFNLRRAAGQRELYRVVEIEGHDASACGGVHVSRTGEVGLVKCLGWEKIRGNCRTIWLVGDRAYRDYARKTELLSALTAELSAPLAELLESARKLKAEVAALRELAERHDLEAAAREAERIASEAPRLGASGVIVRRLEGASRAYFRALGTELSRRPGVTALLANVEAGSAQLLACRGPDVVLDLGATLKPHLSVVNGKGGGREGTWQGVAQDLARLDEFLERARSALGEARGAS